MVFDASEVIGECAGGARRIGIVCAHASPLDTCQGGQQRYITELARELARCGHLVDIFTRREHTGQQPVVLWRDNVRIIHLSAGPVHRLAPEDLLPHLDAFARCMARFIRRQPCRYDILHAHFFLSGIAAEHIKNVLGIPFVITFHGLGQVRRKALGAADTFPLERSGIEARLMHEAARIIATCPEERHDMQHLYGAPRQCISVVPGGFDPQELWPLPMRLARTRLGLPHAKFIVLQLGSIAASKGIGTTIDALALLRRRHAVDAMLVVAGGPADHGAELARLRQLTCQLGVAEHVLFIGHQDRTELRYCYSAADVVTSTAWFASCGLAPLEAMACARPVVATEIGGIGHTVIDGRTGFLVAPREPAALADRLAALQLHPGLARAMGDLGMQRAFESYTWRALARRTAALYATAASTAQHANV